MRKVIGWILMAVFGANLIYSLFFTMGESFVSHIPAIALSIVMIGISYFLIRKKGETIDKEKPIL